MTHRTTEALERIRWSDLDMAGIMYFGNYTRLFEIGETELLRQADLSYTEERFAEWGAWPLRVNYTCDFAAPAFLDDLVRISIWVGKLGGASFRLDFAVRREATGELLGQGHCSIVTVDQQTRKAVRLPEAIRAGLTPWLRPQQ